MSCHIRYSNFLQKYESFLSWENNCVYGVQLLNNKCLPEIGEMVVFLHSKKKSPYGIEYN